MNKAVFIFAYQYNGRDTKIKNLRVNKLKSHFDKIYGSGNYLILEGENDDISVEGISNSITDIDENTKFFVMASGGFPEEPENHILDLLHTNSGSQVNTIEYINSLQNVFKNYAPGKVMDLTIISCNAPSILPYIDTENLHITTFGSELEGIWRKEGVQTLFKITEYAADNPSKFSAGIGAILHSHEEINIASKGKFVCLKPRTDQHKQSIFHDIHADLIKYKSFISDIGFSDDIDIDSIELPTPEPPKDTLNFYYRKHDCFMLSRAIFTPEIKKLVEEGEITKSSLHNYFINKRQSLILFSTEDIDLSEDLYDESTTDIEHLNKLFKVSISYLNNNEFIQSDYFITHCIEEIDLAYFYIKIFETSNNYDLKEILIQSFLYQSPLSPEPNELIEKLQFETVELIKKIDPDYMYEFDLNKFYSQLDNAEVIEHKAFPCFLAHCFTKAKYFITDLVIMKQAGATNIDLAHEAKNFLEYSNDFSVEYEYAASFPYIGLHPKFKWAMYVEQNDLESMYNLLHNNHGLISEFDQCNYYIRKDIHKIFKDLLNAESTYALEAVIDQNYVRDNEFLHVTAFANSADYALADAIFHCKDNTNISQILIESLDYTISGEHEQYNKTCQNMFDDYLSQNEGEINAVYSMITDDKIIDEGFLAAILFKFESDPCTLDHLFEIKRDIWATDKEIADEYAQLLKSSNDYSIEYKYAASDYNDIGLNCE